MNLDEMNLDILANFKKKKVSYPSVASRALSCERHTSRKKGSKSKSHL